MMVYIFVYKKSFKWIYGLEKVRVRVRVYLIESLVEMRKRKRKRKKIYLSSIHCTLSLMMVVAACWRVVVVMEVGRDEVWSSVGSVILFKFIQSPTQTVTWAHMMDVTALSTINNQQSHANVAYLHTPTTGSETPTITTIDNDTPPPQQQQQQQHLHCDMSTCSNNTHHLQLIDTSTHVEGFFFLPFFCSTKVYN